MRRNRVEKCEELLATVAGDQLDRLTERDPDDRVVDLDVTAADREAPNLVESLYRNPEPVLSALAEAVQQHPVFEKPRSQARVNLVNLPDDRTLTVGAERVSELYGIISLKGQVTKRTEVLPKLDVAVFECAKCDTRMRVPQPTYGSIREARMCEGCEDPNAFLSLNKRESEWIDYQKVRLQQPPEEALDGVTADIDIHLTDELCAAPDEDGVQAGMRATFTGVYEAVTVKGNTVHDKTFIGNAYEAEEKAYEDIDTAAFGDEIQQLADHEGLYPLLVESIAPDHEGDEHIKEALVLQQFGGWSRTGPEGSFHRGNSHVFLIGDPGAGKTGLMQQVAEIAPRAAMTDGTGTSAAGLTASLVKDDFSEGEQWTIEAGTLPLAHEGIAVVDELDKGDSSDLDAIHTALESQEVYVSKAGKQATLPAETALLAAANPTGGHYDFTLDFAEQVDLQSPLLSRFDLTFVLTEKEDPQVIRSIGEHMVDSRTTAGKLELGRDVTDAEEDSVSRPIVGELLTAYIAYARTNVHPIIRDPAVKDAIVDWYAGLKDKLPSRRDHTDDAERLSLPVTARKIDATCRLAEASARARLSDEIEMSDVERATQLIDRSLADIGIEPGDNASMGHVDPDLAAEEVGLES